MDKVMDMADLADAVEDGVWVYLKNGEGEARYYKRLIVITPDTLLVESSYNTYELIYTATVVRVLFAKKQEDDNGEH